MFTLKTKLVMENKKYVINYCREKASFHTELMNCFHTIFLISFTFVPVIGSRLNSKRNKLVSLQITWYCYTCGFNGIFATEFRFLKQPQVNLFPFDHVTIR